MQVTFDSDGQYRNVPPSMVVTEFPIVALVKPVQPMNALSPMDVTESGILILVKASQP